MFQELEGSLVMKNSKIICLNILFFIKILCIFFVGLAWGGNSELIEKRIDQMDQLNKSVVGSLPDLPKNGRVEAKVFINERKTTKILFKTYDKKSSLIKEGKIQLNKKHKDQPSLEGEADGKN